MFNEIALEMSWINNTWAIDHLDSWIHGPSMHKNGHMATETPIQLSCCYWFRSISRSFVSSSRLVSWSRTVIIIFKLEYSQDKKVSLTVAQPNYRHPGAS